MRKIVMISDYVEEYDADDYAHDKKYLELLQKDLGKEKIEFEYIESKSLLELENSLKKFKKNEIVIFNWFEEIPGIPNSAPQVAKFLEDSGFVFTGASSQNLITTQSKELTKQILVENGVRTPKAQIVRVGESNAKIDLQYPVIIKTAHQHMSIGISKDSVAQNETEAQAQIEKMFGEYKQDVIVEEFIIGPEYEVSVWGYKTLQTLPPIEVTFNKPNKDGIDVYSYNSKWAKNTQEFTQLQYDADKTLSSEILEQIEHETQKAFRALNCQDFVRMELRIKDSKAWIFDINVNPYLNYDATFFMATQKIGYNHGQTIAKICEIALERSGFDS